MHAQLPPLDQDADKTFANLLCMLHLYFGGGHCTRCEEKLKHAICMHLQRIGHMREIGPVTRETSLELADHWLMRMQDTRDATQH